MEKASLADLTQSSSSHTALERLFSTRSLKVRIEAGVPVAVVAIQRYLAEQSQGCRQNPQHDSYNFDVTVTDGVWRAKCFLDRGLNHLVHRQILRTGTDIRITDCAFVYNERRLGHGHMCIEQFKCDSERSEILQTVRDVDGLPTLTKHGLANMGALHSDTPLQLSRKHYLSLWNNDDPEGGEWTSHLPASEVLLDVSKITLLCDLTSSSRSTWKPLPLLVRILHKSRLRYYGRFGMNIDYPYQAYFEVADQSGTMSLVLWNELCPEWYQRLTVGAVLYLQNYTIKQSYSKRSRPQMDHHRMHIFDSVGDTMVEIQAVMSPPEICLNPRNPASVLTVVSPKSIPSQWGLPEVAYQFVTRSELENLTNNSACDVIGLVMFVGRVERVKSNAKKGPEKYWTYRWVHAVDGSSGDPFILEIFSSSHPEIFNGVCPMNYLVCTQMRVCGVDGSSPYLTSSCETEMFITGYHRGQPYVSDPKVRSFIQWTKTLKDHVVLKKTLVGGYYCFPHSPRIFSQPTADGSAQIPLVAAVDLKRELEALQYREHRRLAVQGAIVAVRYVKSEQDDSNGKEVPDGSVDGPVEAAPDLVPNQTSTADQTAPPSEKISASKRKRVLKKRNVGSGDPATGQEEPSSESVEEEVEERANPQQGNDNQGRTADPECNTLSWESDGWQRQRQEVTDHLRQGGLHGGSLTRMFMLDESSALLQWVNLPPSKWTSEQSSAAGMPAAGPGYFHTTILGINNQIAMDAAFLPVVSSGDPRAVGLLQEPHGNTLLSCLLSGFLCPLVDPASPGEGALPDPEDILATAQELEDTHVLCILDLCHMGGDQVEVMLHKVYRLSDCRLD